MQIYAIKKETITTPSKRVSQLCIFLQILEQLVSPEPTLEEIRRAFPQAYELCAEEFGVKSSTSSNKYIRELKEKNSKVNLGTERFAMLIHSWLNGDPNELREVLKEGIVLKRVSADLSFIDRTLFMRRNAKKSA